MSATVADLPHIQSKAPDELVKEQLSALAATLLDRRDAILEAWRAADDAAPERSPGSSLSRVQFNDHIPAVLDCLAHTIQAWPDAHPLAGETETERACEHGLQRWQQGYQLRELIREWGHLQMCVGDELADYEVTHLSLDPRVMPIVRRAWAQLCADSVTQSATQYWRLHQSESAGHVHHLEKALSALHAIEQQRAEAWRRAAHDLRGSVTVVKGATTLLSADGEDALPEVMREEVAEMLAKSVSSLHDMLNDLLSLARLEAGLEHRELTTFDAAAVLHDFCTASQAAAKEHGLYLKAVGPTALPVQGDKAKVVRILQNLLLNALKYTQKGGVTVTWGLDKSRDTDRWTFSVQDTGPGIDEAVAAPLAQDLHRATEVSNDAKESNNDRRREIASATTLPSASTALPEGDQPGEGVGLSIVKRLCELLDAGLELATEPGRGSTFRVILPRSYDSV